MKKERNRINILTTLMAILIAALFFSASIYAQSDNSGLWFDVPTGWTKSTVNGMTSYTSPDYNYTLVVTPFSASGEYDYKSQAALENYLKNYKWTSDNTYTPYKFDNWMGYSTTAHTIINGKDVTGYSYYVYDPSTPNRGYYYNIYTPTSGWSSNQATMSKLLSTVKYNYLDPKVNEALNNSDLIFDIPSGWTRSTVNGKTSYTSPDYNYTLIVDPFSTSIASDYTSQSVLDSYLKNYNLTSSDNKYNPYKIGNWMGYNTTVRTTIDGKEVTGMSYYVYDPASPNRGYYYYMYTPTSNWSTSQSEMTKLLSSARYGNVDPGVEASAKNSLLFSLPSGWTSTTTSDGITKYYSPDNSYTLIVSPYTSTSTSDYTSQAVLENFLKDSKWTAESAYDPYSIDNNWKGYSTAAHSTINGTDVTGYVYYGYDPNNPGRGYYYYMYTPSTSWKTNAAEMQKLMNSARYNPVNPNLQNK